MKIKATIEKKDEKLKTVQEFIEILKIAYADEKLLIYFKEKYNDWFYNFQKEWKSYGTAKSDAIQSLKLSKFIRALSTAIISLCLLENFRCGLNQMPCMSYLTLGLGYCLLFFAMNFISVAWLSYRSSPSKYLFQTYNHLEYVISLSRRLSQRMKLVERTLNLKDHPKTLQLDLYRPAEANEVKFSYSLISLFNIYGIFLSFFIFVLCSYFHYEIYPILELFACCLIAFTAVSKDILNVKFWRKIVSKRKHIEKLTNRFMSWFDNEYELKGILQNCGVSANVLSVFPQKRYENFPTDGYLSLLVFIVTCEAIFHSNLGDHDLEKALLALIYGQYSALRRDSSENVLIEIRTKHNNCEKITTSAKLLSRPKHADTDNASDGHVLTDNLNTEKKIVKSISREGRRQIGTTGESNLRGLENTSLKKRKSGIPRYKGSRQSNPVFPNHLTDTDIKVYPQISSSHNHFDLGGEPRNLATVLNADFVTDSNTNLCRGETDLSRSPFTPLFPVGASNTVMKTISQPSSFDGNMDLNREKETCRAEQSVDFDSDFISSSIHYKGEYAEVVVSGTSDTPQFPTEAPNVDMNGSSQPVQFDEQLYLPHEPRNLVADQNADVFFGSITDLCCKEKYREENLSRMSVMPAFPALPSDAVIRDEKFSSNVQNNSNSIHYKGENAEGAVSGTSDTSQFPTETPNVHKNGSSQLILFDEKLALPHELRNLGADQNADAFIDSITDLCWKEKNKEANLSGMSVMRPFPAVPPDTVIRDEKFSSGVQNNSSSIHYKGENAGAVSGTSDTSLFSTEAPNVDKSCSSHPMLFDEKFDLPYEAKPFGAYENADVFIDSITDSCCKEENKEDDLCGISVMPAFPAVSPDNFIRDEKFSSKGQNNSYSCNKDNIDFSLNRHHDVEAQKDLRVNYETSEFAFSDPQYSENALTEAIYQNYEIENGDTPQLRNNSLNLSNSEHLNYHIPYTQQQQIISDSQMIVSRSVVLYPEDSKRKENTSISSQEAESDEQNGGKAADPRSGDYSYSQVYNSISENECESNIFARLSLGPQQHFLNEVTSNNPEPKMLPSEKTSNLGKGDGDDLSEAFAKMNIHSDVMSNNASKCNGPHYREQFNLKGKCNGNSEDDKFVLIPLDEEIINPSGYENKEKYGSDESQRDVTRSDFSRDVLIPLTPTTAKSKQKLQEYQETAMGTVPKGNQIISEENASIKCPLTMNEISLKLGENSYQTEQMIIPSAEQLGDELVTIESGKFLSAGNINRKSNKTSYHSLEVITHKETFSLTDKCFKDEESYENVSCTAPITYLKRNKQGANETTSLRRNVYDKENTPKNNSLFLKEKLTILTQNPTIHKESEQNVSTGKESWSSVLSTHEEPNEYLSPTVQIMTDKFVPSLSKEITKNIEKHDTTLTTSFESSDVKMETSHLNTDKSESTKISSFHSRILNKAKQKPIEIETTLKDIEGPINVPTSSRSAMTKQRVIRRGKRRSKTANKNKEGRRNQASPLNLFPPGKSVEPISSTTFVGADSMFEELNGNSSRTEAIKHTKEPAEHSDGTNQMTSASDTSLYTEKRKEVKEDTYETLLPAEEISTQTLFSTIQNKSEIQTSKEYISDWNWSYCDRNSVNVESRDTIVHTEEKEVINGSLEDITGSEQETPLGGTPYVHGISMNHSEESIQHTTVSIVDSKVIENMSESDLLANDVRIDGENKQINGSLVPSEETVTHTSTSTVLNDTNTETSNKINSTIRAIRNNKFGESNETFHMKEEKIKDYSRDLNENEIELSSEGRNSATVDCKIKQWNVNSQHTGAETVCKEVKHITSPSITMVNDVNRNSRMGDTNNNLPQDEEINTQSLISKLINKKKNETSNESISETRAFCRNKENILCDVGDYLNEAELATTTKGMPTLKLLSENKSEDSILLPRDSALQNSVDINSANIKRLVNYKSTYNENENIDGTSTPFQGAVTQISSSTSEESVFSLNRTGTSEDIRESKDFVDTDQKTSTCSTKVNTAIQSEKTIKSLTPEVEISPHIITLVDEKEREQEIHESTSITDGIAITSENFESDDSDLEAGGKQEILDNTKDFKDRGQEKPSEGISPLNIISINRSEDYSALQSTDDGNRESIKMLLNDKSTNTENGKINRTLVPCQDAVTQTSSSTSEESVFSLNRTGTSEDIRESKDFVDTDQKTSTCSAKVNTAIQSEETIKSLTSEVEISPHIITLVDEKEREQEIHESTSITDGIAITSENFESDDSDLEADGKQEILDNTKDFKDRGQEITFEGISPLNIISINRSEDYSALQSTDDGNRESIKMLLNDKSTNTENGKINRTLVPCQDAVTQTSSSSEESFLSLDRTGTSKDIKESKSFGHSGQKTSTCLTKINAAIQTEEAVESSPPDFEVSPHIITSVDQKESEKETRGSTSITDGTGKNSANVELKDTAQQTDGKQEIPDTSKDFKDREQKITYADIFSANTIGTNISEESMFYTKDSSLQSRVDGKRSNIEMLVNDKSTTTENEEKNRTLIPCQDAVTQTSSSASEESVLNLNRTETPKDTRESKAFKDTDQKTSSYPKAVNATTQIAETVESLPSAIEFSTHILTSVDEKEREQETHESTSIRDGIAKISENLESDNTDQQADGKQEITDTTKDFKEAEQELTIISEDIPSLSTVSINRSEESSLTTGGSAVESKAVEDMLNSKLMVSEKSSENKEINFSIPASETVTQTSSLEISTEIENGASKGSSITNELGNIETGESDEKFQTDGETGPEIYISVNERKALMAETSVSLKELYSSVHSSEWISNRNDETELQDTVQRQTPNSEANFTKSCPDISCFAEDKNHTKQYGDKVPQLNPHARNKREMKIRHAVDYEPEDDEISKENESMKTIGQSRRYARVQRKFKRFQSLKKFRLGMDTDENRNTERSESGECTKDASNVRNCKKSSVTEERNCITVFNGNNIKEVHTKNIRIINSDQCCNTSSFKGKNEAESPKSQEIQKWLRDTSKLSETSSSVCERPPTGSSENDNFYFHASTSASDSTFSTTRKRCTNSSQNSSVCNPSSKNEQVVYENISVEDFNSENQQYISDVSSNIQKGFIKWDTNLVFNESEEGEEHGPVLMSREKSIANDCPKMNVNATGTLKYQLMYENLEISIPDSNSDLTLRLISEKESDPNPAGRHRELVETRSGPSSELFFPTKTSTRCSGTISPSQPLDITEIISTGKTLRTSVANESKNTASDNFLDQPCESQVNNERVSSAMNSESDVKRCKTGIFHSEDNETLLNYAAVSNNNDSKIDKPLDERTSQLVHNKRSDRSESCKDFVFSSDVMNINYKPDSKSDSISVSFRKKLGVTKLTFKSKHKKLYLKSISPRAKK